MRVREIWDYISESPYNTNLTIFKQMMASFAEREKNELYSYTVDSDIEDSVDLFGKKASDLQKGVWIDDGLVRGTLKYVTDYDGFSSKEEEKHGYYIALHFALDGADSITINGSRLDSDGIIVLITAPGRAGKVKVEIVKGNESIVDYIDLKGLDFDDLEV